MVERFVIPRRSGRAWPVKAGQIFRIVAVEGPQVADLNLWSLTNPRERFWASRSASSTRRMCRRSIGCGRAALPAADAHDHRRHRAVRPDEDGAGCHDLLGTRCDPYVHKLLNGEEWDLSCHSNLTRAVPVSPDRAGRPRRPQRVPGHRSHRGGEYFTKPSPARGGDFIEFFAELDVLAALTVCRTATCPSRCGARAPATAWTSAVRWPCDLAAGAGAAAPSCACRATAGATGCARPRHGFRG